MSLRLTPVSIALLVAGCGPPPAPPPSDMPARTCHSASKSTPLKSTQHITPPYTASPITKTSHNNTLTPRKTKHRPQNKQNRSTIKHILTQSHQKHPRSTYS